MSKELEKIVKDMVVYLLKRRGCTVEKVHEDPMAEWFSGFWLESEDALLEQCSHCAKRLANCALKECPNGIIKVGNIRLDKTFHDNRGQYYYNFGLELGGA